MATLNDRYPANLPSEKLFEIVHADHCVPIPLPGSRTTMADVS